MREILIHLSLQGEKSIKKDKTNFVMVSFSGNFFFYYNIIIENVDINQSNNWAKNHIMDDSRFDNKVIDAESSSSYIVLNLQLMHRHIDEQDFLHNLSWLTLLFVLYWRGFLPYCLSLFIDYLLLILFFLFYIY